MTPQDLLNDFQRNCVDFIDELIELFPTEADLILARHLIKDTLPPEFIMNGIIKDILPHKDNIRNRNSDFFLNLADVGLSQTHASRVRILWRSSVLDDQDRKVIWTWIDSFVQFAEHYQKLKIQAD